MRKDTLSYNSSSFSSDCNHRLDGLRGPGRAQGAEHGDESDQDRIQPDNVRVELPAQMTAIQKDIETRGAAQWDLRDGRENDHAQNQACQDPAESKEERLPENDVADLGLCTPMARMVPISLVRS